MHDQAEEHGCASDDVFGIFTGPIPGETIVDVGAGEGLTGSQACHQLQESLHQRGWNACVLDERPKPASGVGGTSPAKCFVLIPMFVGHRCGFVKVKVLEAPIPHLISVGLLEHLKVKIDLAEDTISFAGSPSFVKMMRLQTAHRVISILPQRSFDPALVPSELMAAHLGITADSFRATSAKPAYMVHGRGHDRSHSDWPGLSGNGLSIQVTRCHDVRSCSMWLDQGFGFQSIDPSQTASHHAHESRQCLAWPRSSGDAADGIVHVNPGQAAFAAKIHERPDQSQSEGRMGSTTADMPSSIQVSSQGRQSVCMLDSTRWLPGTHPLSQSECF